MINKGDKGFTLVELLVVVSLIIIIVGVAGDIVITVVRSYNKTQIANEVEQNANFVVNKFEKELRNASEVVEVGSNNEYIEFVLTLPDGTTQNVTYRRDLDLTDESGAPSGNPVYAMARMDDDDSSYIPLTNYTFPSGVTVDQGATNFELISTNPETVKVTLTMRQIGNPAVQFTQDTTIEKTIVVRGSY